MPPELLVPLMAPVPVPALVLVLETELELALPEPVSLVLEPEPLVPLLLVRPPQLRNPMLQ